LLDSLLQEMKDDVHDELLALQSIYCEAGEYQQLSSACVKIQAGPGIWLTLELPTLYPEEPPLLSVSMCNGTRIVAI